MTEASDTPVKFGKRGPDEGSTSARKADRSKRIRVSRACDQCRAGREKCDGNQPVCSTCENLDRACSYNEQPKKRGIQPNYIRTLELTLAWLFKQYPDSERCLSQLLPNADEETHRLLACRDAAASDRLHATWRGCLVSRQIDQLLSGTDIEKPGETANEHRPNGRQAPYQSPPLSAPSDASVLPTDVQGAIPLRHDTTPAIHEIRSPQAMKNDVLRLPRNAWALLDYYFSFTHTWLPISEKSDMLRTMYSYPTAGLPRKEAISPEHTELWSIMAWSAHGVGSDIQSTDGEWFAGIARSLLPRNRGFHLCHVKALLILGLIDLANQSWPSAWLTIGSAVRLLTYLTSQGSSATTSSQTRFQHTCMAAFLLESAVSSRTSALMHLRPDFIAASGSLLEDGLEEWSPWHDPTSHSDAAFAKSPARSISTFNHLVRLAISHHETCKQGPAPPMMEQRLDVVFDLIHNASNGTGKVQPFKLLSLDLSHLNVPARHPAQDSLVPEMIFRGNNPFQPGVSHMLDREVSNIAPERSYSLPGMTESQAILQSPDRRHTNSSMVAAQQFNQSEPIEAPAGFSTDSGPSANDDLFEQLAMLDPTDSHSNPNFMQNLGFGPDLDLAEFFGEDYQPSDPLLAFVQPSTFGGVTGGRADFDTHPG